MTTLNTIIEEEKKELESFDSFFAGLASWEEKNAVKLYEKYVLSVITTAMQRASEERDTYWKERVRKTGRKIKKPTLTHAEIQLLDRHEREEYGEEVVGFNAGVDTLLDNLK